MISLFFTGFLLLTLLWNLYYAKHWKRDLSVSLEFLQNFVYAGDQTKMQERIENRKKLPLPVLEVSFHVDKNLSFHDCENTNVSDYTYKRDIFALLGRQRITRTLTLDCPKRGFYRIDKSYLAAFSLLHGDRFSAESCADTSLYVYAARCNVSEIIVICERLMGNLQCAKRLYEDPFAFSSIREYTTADPMNTINWKATAKTGALMVNTFESTLTEQVMIYLDLEDRGILKYEHLIEESVSVAASLAQRLIGRGMEVGLCINAGIGGFATQNIPAAATTRLPVNNSESPSSRMEKDTAKKTPPIIILAPAGGKKQLADMEQVLAIRRADKDIVPFTKLFSEPSFADNSFFRSCRDAITIVISKNATQNQSAIERLIGQDQQAVWVVPYTAKEDCDVKTLSNIHVVRREVSPY